MRGRKKQSITGPSEGGEGCGAETPDISLPKNLKVGANTNERARLATAQAELVELKTSILRGEVIEVDEVVAEVTGRLADVRAAMLALPSRVWARLSHLSAEEIGVIEDELISAMQRISDEFEVSANG